MACIEMQKLHIELMLLRNYLKKKKTLKVIFDTTKVKHQIDKQTFQEIKWINQQVEDMI